MEQYIDTESYNTLLGLLKVQSNSENEKLMVLYLDKELHKLNLDYGIDSAGNILVIKGKSKTYPCVVSHMDTVHSFVSDFTIYTRQKNKDILFAKSNKQKVGIGGDDKCGIFACLYLLKVVPEIKVVFFSREEVGCKGSDKVNHRFFDDCRYIIQLDRKGNKDFIQAYCGKKTVSHTFSSEIGAVKKKYHYKTAIGTVTDVMKLWNNRIGISCINLSCGFYNPHSPSEYISIKDLWHSIKFTKEIIQTLKPKRYTSLPVKIVTTYNNFNYKNDWSKTKKCEKCGEWKKLYSFSSYTYNTTTKDKEYGNVCWQCKQKEKNKKNSSPNIIPKDSYTCLSCGEKLTKTSGVIRSINGKLYCPTCAINATSLICNLCREFIPDNDFEIRDGEKICSLCCEKLDAMTKELLGTRICEECKAIIPPQATKITKSGKPICINCAISNKSLNRY